GRRPADDAGRPGLRHRQALPHQAQRQDRSRGRSCRRPADTGNARMSRLLPFIGFMLLVGLFGFGIWWNTQHDPNAIPTPLLDKPAPAFNLPKLYEPAQRVSKADLLGKPYLLNVFASWCIDCGVEHPVLEAAGPSLGVRLVGYNYKDAPADAKRWLGEHGNPYDLLVADEPG